MTDSTVVPPPSDRLTWQTAWPVVASGVAVIVGTLIGRQQAPGDSAEQALLFPLLALFVLAVTLLVLTRIPGAAITRPTVRLAATTAALIGLLPWEAPAQSLPLLLWVITSPWRYALAPLLVHFALQLAWPHRAGQWYGTMLGFLVLHALLWLASLGGLVVGEPALVHSIDGTLRQTILEPAAWLVALLAGVLAMLSPDRTAGQRRAIVLGTAAVGLAFGSSLITHLLPRLGLSTGADTPWDAMGLLLFAPLGGLAAVAVPRATARERDRLGHDLALRLLSDRPLGQTLTEVAEQLGAALEADGVRLQLHQPDAIAVTGRGHDLPIAPTWPLRIETRDHRRELSAPIGPRDLGLGEIHLISRRHGAFGRAERDWLAAVLIPMTAVIHAHRREAAARDALAGIQARHSTVATILREAMTILPAPTRDDGMGVPPPVDASDVLNQLGEGITAAARQGEAADTHAATVRLAARQTSDEIARALDTLGAMVREIEGLHGIGDEIASSNETVSAIAFRTNLLANNAALEASRSGAAGRAFGVLAEEIRRLADSTAETSAAIGERTASLTRDMAAMDEAMQRIRDALHAAITQAETTETSTRHLHDQVGAVQSTARVLRPALDEAWAVARRRSERDTHQSAMLTQFLEERHQTVSSLQQHRQHLEDLLEQLLRS